MVRILRVLLSVLLAIGTVRVLAYFLYAWAQLATPLEASHLEAKMVLLAYRVEGGERLYPPWRDYPHVANFFGPVYFVLTGLLGSVTGADIRGLFLIGRGITFVSSLLTSLALGVLISRQYGRGAGLAGAVLSLGAVPMVGFSVMVRPDALAELLGLLGFFLSGLQARAGRIAGCVLLILAVLTKQTAVSFLLAAAIALAAEGRWRRALGVLGGCTLVLSALIVAVSLSLEPNFASALVGEAKTPWSAANGLTILRRIGYGSPDLLLLPVLGLGLWLRRRISPWEMRALVLTIVLLAGSLVLSWKDGADTNYYLSLRAAEALAVGSLWHAASTAGTRGRSAALLGAVMLAVFSLIPGTLSMGYRAYSARQQAEFLDGPVGRSFLGSYQRVIDLARDPESRLLTDSGLLDLYRGRRAEFGDPFLFRVLVETGQIRPTRMREKIDSQDYDLIVTTSDIFSKAYETYPFGLPMTLVERARARYVPIGREAGLFFYGRRGGGGVPHPLSGGGRGPG
jgi:hypothetical protein